MATARQDKTVNKSFLDFFTDISKKTQKPPTKKVKTSHTKIVDSIVRRSFFDLPREIRDNIYFHALAKPLFKCWECRKYHGYRVNGVQLGDIYTTCFGSKGGPRTFAPKLLQANKQIRLEASPIYYGQNSIYVFIHGMHFCHFYSWLQLLGAVSLEIRSITLVFDGVSGWADLTQFVATEQRHLSRECIIRTKGNHQMVTAFDSGLTTVKHLRSIGLKWADIAATMRNVTSMMEAFVPGGIYDDDWADLGEELMELDAIEGRGCPHSFEDIEGEEVYARSESVDSDPDSGVPRSDEDLIDSDEL